MVLVHRTVVCCVLCEVLQYIGAYRYMTREKLYFEIRLEAGKPGGLIEARSQIQAGSLIEAEGLTVLS